eukprot:TRINITY_DN3235_c0_g1_i1.p1 TRINITY_DN3235_c0_g1~~TRINITY_DN3235_c0_g1_i1.p1  ORF type:complete len:252 (+),score=42.04 TRINITY_DN3235_c0_g1_i1:463-1218(+)
MALSPCHLDAIPTDSYIPDWRYLLKRPEDGLRMIHMLHAQCIDVVKDQFLSNATFRKQTLRHVDQYTDEEVVSMGVCGFNFPPSQYQLHLQFILPPFIPVQHYMFNNNRHFPQLRFFPYEYVEAVLSLNEPYRVEEATTMEEVVSHFAGHVDYYHHLQVCRDKYITGHARLSNWVPSNFEGFVAENKVYHFVATSGHTALQTGEDLLAVQAADRLALQNYGRPYASAGGSPHPTGSYYSYAKTFPPGLRPW